MKTISLKGAPLEARQALVRELGFECKQEAGRWFVTTKGGNWLLDRYELKRIDIENMCIFPVGDKSKPADILFVDDNVLSLTELFEDYPELAEEE